MRFLLFSLRLWGVLFAEAFGFCAGLALGVALAFTRLLPYLFFGVLGACSMLGIVAAVDALQPPRLPDVRPLWTPNQLPAPRCRKTRAELLAMPWIGRMEQLNNANAILGRVCPDVSAWVWDRAFAGRLRFVEEKTGYWAAWLPWPRKTLLISLDLLEWGDDEFIASTLAHEFRHSRQGVLPGMQRQLALYFGVDRTDLVEDEAYEFGGRVQRAIRGQW